MVQLYFTRILQEVENTWWFSKDTYVYGHSTRAAKLHKPGVLNQAFPLSIVDWLVTACCLVLMVSSLRWGGCGNGLLHLNSITADKTDSKIHVRAPHQNQHEWLLYSFTWYLKAFLRFLFNVSSWKRDYSLRLHSLRLFYSFPFICSFFFFPLESTWRRNTSRFQKFVVKIKKYSTWAWILSPFILY